MKTEHFILVGFVLVLAALFGLGSLVDPYSAGVATAEIVVKLLPLLPFLILAVIGIVVYRWVR